MKSRPVILYVEIKGIKIFDSLALNPPNQCSSMSVHLREEPYSKNYPNLKGKVLKFYSDIFGCFIKEKFK